MHPARAAPRLIKRVMWGDIQRRKEDMKSFLSGNLWNVHTDTGNPTDRGLTAKALLLTIRKPMETEAPTIKKH